MVVIKFFFRVEFRELESWRTDTDIKEKGKMKGDLIILLKVKEIKIILNS